MSVVAPGLRLASPLHCIDFASPSLAMELDAIVHKFLNGPGLQADQGSHAAPLVTPLLSNREVRAVDAILHGLLNATFLPAELLMNVRTRLEALYFRNGMRVYVTIRLQTNGTRTRGSILRVTVMHERRSAARLDHAGPLTQVSHHALRIAE